MQMVPGLKNNSSFNRLFEVIENNNDNVFITGKAGTGKSTFLLYLKRNTKKKYIVVAPTGIAALNVRGQTIHSFFKFKPKLLEAKDIKKVDRSDKIYSKIDLLIIDEISMVRADVFDAIERFLSINGPKPGEKFGGVQICVIGDLFQLPPVISQYEKENYYKLYRSPFFFTSHSFKMGKFKMFELKDVYRQLNSNFIEVLNQVRLGFVSDQALEYINSRYVGLERPIEEGAIVISSTNIIAEQINKVQLDKIDNPSHKYDAKISGNFADSDDKLPAPRSLVLKLGSQVMFIRNDSKRRWVNGTIGTVVRLGSGIIEVAIGKKNSPTIVEVEPEIWDNISYNYNEELEIMEEKVLGSYIQYPLIYAWAITIHKSQGKTLDKIVVDLGRGAFANGQVYVALSRCPELSNIFLRQKISKRDIKSDSEVIRFYKEYAVLV